VYDDHHSNLEQAGTSGTNPLDTLDPDTDTYLTLEPGLR